jgi:amino acid transporter
MNVAKIREMVFGKALDPMKSETRHSMALVAFLAWVGLGADGLSSSSYGPEETFRALGAHTHLGLYMALATAVTVFIIALAYNQVIELFPTGGGGYRVATKLVGPYMGLISGCALILDYVLTIAISVASGVDALASFLPLGFQSYKLSAEVFFIGVLIILNLRGLKEAIQILLPIFLGFVVTHLILIVYGILAHASHLPTLVPNTLAETTRLAKDIGWIGVAGMLLLGYSQGGGTYTGLEAVSNNVNILAEPRVRTGKITMFYMAMSLAFTAGGIILLYLLWDAKPVEGQTLNASTFKIIIASMGLGGPILNQGLLVIVLAFEAGLLFVAANTGFLGGPAVLSNMAVDSWVPHKFRYLSTRLVTQNGILVLGLAALAILFWTRGSVTLLVVLYSISVFLTFAISLFGLCRYWWQNRGRLEHWRRRFLLSLVGFIICAGILAVLLVEKFTKGGWVTAFIIALIAGLCIVIREHYRDTKEAIHSVDAVFANDNWFTRLLHNQASLAIQRRLHFDGLQMVILPMKV